MPEPKAYRGIMVSSTFLDLKDHRSAVIEAIKKLDFHDNAMENSGAQADTDLIDTSLDLVRNSAAFIGVIGRRYGVTPECPVRNPDRLSISELEFNEAMRLGRPILLFVMGDAHLLTVAEMEGDAEKKMKLDAFRERAKQMRSGSPVQRIYEEFNSREEFAQAAAIAVGKLSRGLQPPGDDVEDPDDTETVADSVETALPPYLRAVPRYLGSHEFVGREAELNKLDDWCAAADQHPMLLFEAIGGSGKSMVTWTWLNDRAVKAREDWAGRFWFSFYEGGATMTRFCREALAYMTGKPVKTFYKDKIRTLMPRLIAELQAHPWLIVLDGLERILVAYHRIDAPQMRDEDAEGAEDQIAKRDPCAAINPDDDELLRQLTVAAPSKILVTSRLKPQALLNRAGVPLPGVRSEILPGLRPPDAEQLFRSCGVSGTSKVIQEYLQRNCDCHPLVIGALAGLVNNYMRERGNFDAWLEDPAAGGRLDLADLDLSQRRNHILDAAIEALSEPGRRLLQTLSLLQGSADYATLLEFNPHRPPSPDEVEKPTPVEEQWDWDFLEDDDKKSAEAKYERDKKTYESYMEALRAWKQSAEMRRAVTQFDETLAELEQRGLLQYEHGLKRYDLHPVVRGVAAGRMGEEETSDLGSRVVDYFSSRQHDPFEQAETLEALAPGIQTIATLTRIGEFDRAFSALDGDLIISLYRNLLAFGEMQRLVRPFFPQGWDGPLAVSDLRQQANILLIAGSALRGSDLALSARLNTRNLQLVLSEGWVSYTTSGLFNFTNAIQAQGRLAVAQRLRTLCIRLTEASDIDSDIFMALLAAYELEAKLGMYDRADMLWAQLNPMGRGWPRERYAQGNAELIRADHLYSRGMLTEQMLAEAELLCRNARNRSNLCACLGLRGEWHLSKGEPDLAIEPLSQALRLYHEAGRENTAIEALLALAKLRAGRYVDALAVADKLDNDTGHDTLLAVAELCYELGEFDRAKSAALRAHKSASGCGEPYVYRHALDCADALLRKLGEVPPEVPQHDPANDEVFDWESDVIDLIENTLSENAALVSDNDNDNGDGDDSS